MSRKYPKQLNYLSPPGYLQWKKHLEWCERQAIEGRYASVPEALLTSDMHVGLLGSLQSNLILKDRAPALYLSEEMVETALGMEDVPLEETTPIVFNSMHLMLPANSFPTEVPGHYITSVCARVIDTATVPNATADAGSVTVRIFASSTEKGLEDHAAMYLGDIATKKLGEGSGYVRQGLDLCTNDQIDDVTSKLNRLVANVLLSLAYAPSLRRSDSEVVNYGKGFGSLGKSDKNLLPITWLGNNGNFNQTADAVISAREHSGVKRKSPQMHWRRGHFRRHTDKDGTVGTVFVKPTLVCATNEEDA